MIALVVKTLLGIEVTTEVQMAFVVVILFVMGLFAKDAGTGKE